MKNRNIFTKLLIPALNTSLLISLFALAGFAQSNLPAPRQETLLNGLKVLMWADTGAKDTTVKIRIHSGAAFDPQGKEGVMKVLAESIFPTIAAREFFTDDLGGSLEIITTYDYIQINASSKSEGFLTMLETLSAAVSNPAIDKETTVKVRDALLPKVKVMESDPAYVADRAVAKRLFGTFPYGRPEFGTTESLQKIDFADLIDAKKRFLTADNATVTISGNFDNKLAFRAFRRYFGGWLKSDKRVPSTFRQPDEPDTKLLKIELPNLHKSYSLSAMVAPARGDKDYFAMKVLVRIWQDQFSYSDKDESECGRNYYQANLLRGVYGTAVVRKPDERIISRNICGLLLRNTDGSYSYPEIKLADFDKAKANTVSEFNQRVQTPLGLYELWLDLETYKLLSVDDESRKVNGVTLSDIKALVERLGKFPTVSLLVTTPVATN